MNDIKNIIFDVNNVLTKHMHDHDWSIRTIAHEYNIPLPRIRAFFDEYRTVGGKVHGMKIENFWNIKSTDMGPVPLSAIVLSAQQHKNDIVIDQDMISILNNIRLNYRLFALTNTWKPGQAFKSKLEGYFEAFVQSCDIDLRKPDPAIFEYMCNTYKLKQNETLFVDDTLENIASASAIGMHVIHFQNLEKLKEEFKKLQIKEKKPTSS